MGITNLYNSKSLGMHAIRNDVDGNSLTIDFGGAGIGKFAPSADATVGPVLGGIKADTLDF